MKEPVKEPLSLLETAIHWHDVCDLRYRHFLESLTALDFDEASRHLDVFSSLLHARLGLQKNHLQIIDDGAPIQLIEADHMILNKLLDKVRDSIQDIASADYPRSRLVDHLGNLVKLMNVLQHHDIRVTESVYNHAEDVLTEDANLQQANEMNKAMLNAMNAKVH